MANKTSSGLALSLWETIAPPEQRDAGYHQRQPGYRAEVAQAERPQMGQVAEQAQDDESRRTYAGTNDHRRSGKRYSLMDGQSRIVFRAGR